MKLSSLGLIAALFIGSVAYESRADFLIYKIPPDGTNRMGSMPGGAGSGRSGPPPGMIPGGYPAGMMAGGEQAKTSEPRIILTGRQSSQGKTIAFNHQSVRDPLHFDPKDVEVIKAPSAQQEFNKRLGQAGKDAGAVMNASIWALKKGLTREFHTGVEKALSIDPQHEAALRVTELKKKMDEPLPENPTLEQELRNCVRGSGMQIATSRHFIMLHDVATKPAQGKRKNRAQERLDLLEDVYESFLLLFCAQDVELEVPRERLKVILFKDQKDFQELSTSFSPALSSASGFWDPIRNVCVFYDEGTSKSYQALLKLQADLKKSSDEAKKSRSNPELIRWVKTVDLLIEIDRENSDISAVSHDATYQMAGNTGLLPRHVDIPRWVHEGLAAYFEAPGDAAWAGIGAVSQERMEFYRALEQDKVHSNIDFIVADQIIDYTKSQGAAPQGNSQAWGLTHFLLENHAKELVAFYRMLGEMPPDVALNPKLLTDLFNRVFGSDRTALDREWRQYMRSLKSDVERLEESSGSKNRT